MDMLGMSLSMSSMSMDMSSMMASMSMGMSSMSLGMDMDHMTMDHMTMDHMSHLASSTMDMDSMSTGDMDGMGGMDMGLDLDMVMYMYFFKQYKDVPVLFSELKANNGGQAFGIFLLLIVVGIVTRGFEFAKVYLETRVWHNPNYFVAALDGHLTPLNSTHKPSDDGNTTVESKNLSTASLVMRNIIRFWLHFIPELLGFALMLAAMSFSVLYFFGVVLGLSFGRFLFDRLSSRYHIPLNNELHHG